MAAAKKAKGKKPRTKAQKAATAKMLAANRKAAKHGGTGKKPKKTKGKPKGSKKPRTAAQRAATARMIAALHAKKGVKGARAAHHGAVHHDASFQQGMKYAMTHDARGHHVSRLAKKPGKGGGKHPHRSNPSMPERAMHAVGAVVGGAAAGLATFGAIAAMQKFPAKSKAVAVIATTGAAVMAGGAVAALGAPAAGTVITAGLIGVAARTAFAGSGPVAGLVNPQMRGVIDAHRQINGVVNTSDAFDESERAQIRGIVQAINH